MVNIRKIIMLFCFFLISLGIANATQEQLRIDISEYVNQTVYYNPLKWGGGVGIWADNNENQSFYEVISYINISNQNPNGKTISDIYITFDGTVNMTLPVYFSGRNGTFISNDTSSNLIMLHIPEIRGGENSIWTYDLNTSAINPPLNIETSFSASKALAGANFTITDTLENVFFNAPFQTNTCIYGINLVQTTIPVNFSGTFFDFIFEGVTTGTDASNVSYSNANRTQTWNVLNTNCLNLSDTIDIEYLIYSPYNIPGTTDYQFSNTTLEYSLNNTISHLRVVDITAISEAKIDLEKRILYPSHPTLHGSNVTWNITGYFSTNMNITYNLSSATIWVAQRNGIQGDPNTIDNDTISNSQLQLNLTPNELVNLTNSWISTSWLFNYSDMPSPIVYMDVDFKIQNDGTQLINRSITENGNDVYIKEIYLILGYWLEIEKNITSISENEYNIKIDVHNKGNQVTPEGTIVTIYDFIPENFNLSSAFVYSTFPGIASPWHTTTNTSHNVSGQFNGTLHSWALLSTGCGTCLNTSFAAGPGKNENTSWSVEFNVTGYGDYTLLDVFITGLDPQLVDGAGSSKSVIVSEVLDRIKSTEGIFAIVASILLLIGLLL